MSGDSERVMLRENVQRVTPTTTITFLIVKWEGKRRGTRKGEREPPTSTSFFLDLCYTYPSCPQLEKYCSQSYRFFFFLCWCFLQQRLNSWQGYVHDRVLGCSCSRISGTRAQPAGLLCSRCVKSEKS